MPTRSRAAKNKGTSADIWTRKSCRCGQAACGHVQDIICAMEEKDISRQPSVRHQDKRRRLTSADICAIREAELILRQDIKPAVQYPRRRSRFMQLPTSAAHWTSCSTRHQGRSTPAMENELILMQLRHGRQGRGREGAGSGRGSCRTWKSCRHGRGRHQVTFPCRFMQHAHAPDKEELPDIMQDMELRTSGHGLRPCSTPHASAPLRERDIRQRAGHGAAGSGALKHLILIPPAPMVDVEFWTRPAGAAFVPHGVPAPWSTPTRSRDIRLRLRLQFPHGVPTPSADVRFNPSRRSRGVQVMELPSFSSRPSASAGSSAAPMEEAGVPGHSSRLTSGCGRLRHGDKVEVEELKPLQWAGCRPEAVGTEASHQGETQKERKAAAGRGRGRAQPSSSAPWKVHAKREKPLIGRIAALLAALVEVGCFSVDKYP